MKPSRPVLVLALSVLVATGGLRADDGVLPKGPPAARYDAMADRSPFTAPTAAAPVATPPPAPAGPRWWDQMFITSLMDRGGVYYIGLVDKANSKHYVLAAGKTDQDSQLLLTDVQWNDHLDQTTATVRKGSEIAPPIRFDASATPVAPAAPVNAAQVPPFRTQPNGTLPALPPGFTGTPPPPPPTGNPVVRRIAPIASRPGTTPQNKEVPADQSNNLRRRTLVPNDQQ